MKDDAFFVGYLPVPKGLTGFLAAVAMVVLAAAAFLGFSVAATQDDPGDGRFRFDLGRQAITGVLVPGAYPVLRVTEGTEQVPAGHTLMLSGGGKTGVGPRAEGLGGKLVVAEGVLLERGDLDMLQLRGGPDGLRAAEGEAPALPPAEPLGRWRLTGELCDGKCLAGAMRPSRGITHKACANLCIVGGIPPVFVAFGPIDGSTHLLVTAADGGAIPKSLLDRTAEIVEVEGKIERIGDLLVLRADPATARRP